MKQDNEKAHKINNPAFVEQKQILYYRLRNNWSVSKNQYWFDWSLSVRLQCSQQFMSLKISL